MKRSEERGWGGGEEEARGEKKKERREVIMILRVSFDSFLLRYLLEKQEIPLISFFKALIIRIEE